MTNGANGDSSTVGALLHLPISTEATYSSGGDSLVCRIKTPRLQGACQNDHGSHCGSISGPQVAKEKSGVSKAPSKETLEMATILLGLGQHVYLQNTVQQAGSTSKDAPLVQERRLGEHQDHTYSKVSTQPSATSGHVDSCESEGRRKKQANPHRIMPSKLQTQDIKVLHVAQAGHQSISRSGFDTQPGASSGHAASCESKGRRSKQANPRHIMAKGADGRVWISESYCSPTLEPYAPVIDVDISEEPNTVQQAGSTSQDAPLVQERRLGEHQDHTYSKVSTQPSATSGHVDSCESEGRRKKQANPHRIMPSKLQTQDIKVLHVAQAGHQSISRSGFDTQPGASSGHAASCESKGRRSKQANPRHIMASKVQKQDYRVLHVPQAALFCSKASFAGLPYSLNQILGIPQTPCHGFIGGKNLNDGEKFSPQDIDIPLEWSTSPREKEDMFFPHLNDSSYKAEVRYAFI
ncbi:hypothetical protein ACEWY4_016700 [Coilia grayii]|uniref:Uncharacterized protein n=1 Tax=Coilia grayii TaxID=363190 RepID=A0ABD1JL42_9TELE